jgi:hypothetical protein
LLGSRQETASEELLEYPDCESDPLYEGCACRLKIRLSVVRFRPWPPFPLGSSTRPAKHREDHDGLVPCAHYTRRPRERADDNTDVSKPIRSDPAPAQVVFNQHVRVATASSSIMELGATEWRRAMNTAQVTECDAEQVVTETAPSPRLSRSELLQSQMTAEPEQLQAPGARRIVCDKSGQSC